MSNIGKLLDNYGALCDSAENARRTSLWLRPGEGLRGETQWHGIPKFEVTATRPAPVTAECLEKMWVAVLGMDIRRFYTDPEYFLEFFLRFKILKFLRLRDDTPLTRQIPVCFGVTHEAGILGQKTFFYEGEEPQFGREAVFGPDDDLSKPVDFDRNAYLNDLVIPYYNRVKELAGKEFSVLFPQWYRGPQGVALYVRGFENFSFDLYDDPDFAHRTLRYVTETAKRFATWRSEFTQEPIAACDLFNDDIPLMSPDTYRDFILPYERELGEFHGGIAYWHSCGDVTKHVSEIHKLKNIGLFDFGVTMESKEDGMRGLSGPQALELRVFAKPHIQEADEEAQKGYVRGIIAQCGANGIRNYVIRTSGMSSLLGGDRDLDKLVRWVDLVRETQAEISG